MTNNYIEDLPKNLTAAQVKAVRSWLKIGNTEIAVFQYAEVQSGDAVMYYQNSGVNYQATLKEDGEVTDIYLDD